MQPNAPSATPVTLPATPAIKAQLPAIPITDDTPFKPRFIRHAHVGHLAELFFLHAVGAIIVIRVFLTLTGFPQLGGNGLHIAHMLWGGLFMLAALLLQLFFLNRQMRFATAVLGGIGFGTFIDELGKFITSDNNYFFQPTFALLYVLFTALFFVIKLGIERTPLTPREHAANALYWLMASTYQPLDAAQRAELQAHIDKAQWPAATLEVLRALAAGARNEVKASAGLYMRTRQRFNNLFTRVVNTRLFKTALIGIFGLQALVGLLLALLFVFIISGTALTGTPSNLHITTSLIPGTLSTAADDTLTLPDIASVISAAVHMGLTLIGIIRLPRDWYAGLKWFRRALVIDILFSQPFAFYFNQLSATTGLIVSLLLYNAVSYLILQAQPRRQAGLAEQALNT